MNFIFHISTVNNNVHIFILAIDTFIREWCIIYLTKYWILLTFYFQEHFTATSAVCFYFLTDAIIIKLAACTSTVQFTKYHEIWICFIGHLKQERISIDETFDAYKWYLHWLNQTFLNSSRLHALLPKNVISTGYCSYQCFF